MLKKLQLACVLLFIIGCNKYEYVDNTTRFNKSSGNIEKLQNDGSWIKDTYNQVPSNKWKDIKIEFLQFNAGWGCIVTNNSNYTIQNIFLQLQIKDQHIKDELKSSYRIKVKGDNTILGMKQFSIHHPRERNYLNEWLFHKTINREGLISLRYYFVKIILNGNDLGIYALEEHFERRLLENNLR